jgi:hypothetical protein
VTKEKCLQAWTEHVGRFVKLETGESQVSVVMSCGAENVTLSFPRGDLESQTSQRELSSCKLGIRIALIKTDELSRPLLVRKIGT